MRASYQAWINHVEQEENKSRQPYKNSIWLPLPIFKSLDCDGTLHLAILMDFQRRLHPHAERDHAGWFPCSSQDLINRVGEHLAKPAKQTRFLKKLEKAGFIQRKIMGCPPQRYLRIDFDLFCREHLKEIKHFDAVDEEDNDGRTS